ncbi:hypothetical protein GVV04_31490 [Micromonospora sp. NEAU-HG-1]|nr:hypothetical protein [Micromonospora rubida]
MMYPLVGDLAADGIPVAVTCRVLGFSKQAYYAWKKTPVTRRDPCDESTKPGAVPSGWTLRGSPERRLDNLRASGHHLVRGQSAQTEIRLAASTACHRASSQQ